jgi:hypothetical protein
MVARALLMAVAKKWSEQGGRSLAWSGKRNEVRNRAQHRVVPDRPQRRFP